MDINKILVKLLIPIVIVLLVIAGYFYIENKKIESLLEETQDSLYVTVQNESFLQDQLDMKADTIQYFSAKVENLQSDSAFLKSELNTINDKYKNALQALNNWKGKYNLLASNYQILLDSLFISEVTEPQITSDFIIIPFSGQYKKVTYNGKTIYNKVDSTAEYEISIIIDPINIESKIVLDEEKLIKNEIYADGVLIDNAVTRIDSALYLIIRKSQLQTQTPLSFWDRLKIGSQIGVWHPDFSAMKELKDYKLVLQGLVRYQTNRWDITFEKSFLEKDFNLNFNYFMSVNELIYTIF